MYTTDFRSVVRVITVLAILIVGMTVFTNKPHDSWQVALKILELIEEAVYAGSSHNAILPSLIERTVVNPIVSEITEPVKSIKSEVKTVDSRQLDCVATAIWHEARSENVLGQAAVAWVVLNRVRLGFAKTPCAVVYQTHTVYNPNNDTHEKSCQFVWHCDPNTKQPNKNSHAYATIKNLAYDIMANRAYEYIVPPSTVFFHNRTVNPRWRYYKVATIGNHVFYSRRPVRPQDQI